MLFRSPGPQPPSGGRFQILERLTAAVLLLVVASLVWVLAAAYWPDPSESAMELQVIVILVLLTTALLLVSVVALLHTR